MPTFTRVRDRATGHQYDVDVTAFDKAAHERLDSERWPDVTGATAQPRPPKYRLALSADGAPRANAKRQDWEDFAIAQGASPQDVEGLTREELRALFEPDAPDEPDPPAGAVAPHDDEQSSPEGAANTTQED